MAEPRPRGGNQPSSKPRRAIAVILQRYEDLHDEEQRYREQRQGDDDLVRENLCIFGVNKGNDGAVVKLVDEEGRACDEQEALEEKDGSWGRLKSDSSCHLCVSVYSVVASALSLRSLVEYAVKQGV